MGGRKRAMHKSKARRFLKFEAFANIQLAMNTADVLVQNCLAGVTYHNLHALPNEPGKEYILPNGGRVIIKLQEAEQHARDAWFGPEYYEKSTVGEYDQYHNPKTVGNGLLSQLSTRDSNMTQYRWDYSGYLVSRQIVCFLIHNSPTMFGLHLLYIKGIKVTVLGRDNSNPCLCYVGKPKKNSKNWTIKEQVGKIKVYIKTKTADPLQPYEYEGFQVPWDLDPVYIGGQIGTRLKFTIYYKVRATR